VVQPTGMKYYPACSMPADIYVGPLQTLQLKNMKYYPASSMLADIYCPHSKRCSHRYEILPTSSSSQNICGPTPSGPAESLEILSCPGVQRHIFSRLGRCSHTLKYTLPSAFSQHICPPLGVVQPTGMNIPHFYHATKIMWAHSKWSS